jgi:hypothetical protein
MEAKFVSTFFNEETSKKLKSKRLFRVYITKIVSAHGGCLGSRRR